MLELSAVSDRNYESVKDWVDGNKPLVRSESSLYLQSVKDGDIIALRDGSRSQGVIANLLERIVPMLPRKVINKVCYSIREKEFRLSKAKPRFAFAFGRAKASELTKFLRTLFFFFPSFL